MKYLFLVVLLFVGFACSDLNKGKQLKEIGDLEQTLDSIEVVLIENKFEEIDRYFKDAKIVESRIKENYKSDTISLELASKIDRYKEMLQRTPLLRKGYKQLLKDIELQQNSINFLYDDIEHGNGDRSKYEVYILKERENLTLIRISLLTYIKQRKEVIDGFETLHNDVYNFSFELITN